MIEPSRPTVRQNHVRPDLSGIKMLLVAASLAATLGGWAVLANSAKDVPVSPGVASAGVRTDERRPVLRQVDVPVGPPRALARTRSSR